MSKPTVTLMQAEPAPVVLWDREPETSNQTGTETMKIRNLTHLIETLRQVFDHTSEPFEMTVYHLAPGVTLQRVQNKDLAWEHLNPQRRDDWQICDRTEPGIVRRVTVRTSTGEATLDTVLEQAFKASPDPQNAL